MVYPTSPVSDAVSFVQSAMGMLFGLAKAKLIKPQARDAQQARDVPRAQDAAPPQAPPAAAVQDDPPPINPPQKPRLRGRHPCSVRDRTPWDVGLCALHYTQAPAPLPAPAPHKPAVPCATVGCTQNAVGRGLCTRHYTQMLRDYLATVGSLSRHSGMTLREHILSTLASYPDKEMTCQEIWAFEGGRGKKSSLHSLLSKLLAQGLVEKTLDRHGPWWSISSQGLMKARRLATLREAGKDLRP